MEDTAYSLDRFRAAAAALGDPRRLDIVRVLLEGPCTVLEIARQTELRQPLVSHHLSVLVQAGIATARKDGRFRHYRLRDAGEEVGERFVRLLRAELDMPEVAEPQSATAVEDASPAARRSVRKTTKRSRRSGATNGDSGVATGDDSRTPKPVRKKARSQSGPAVTPDSRPVEVPKVVEPSGFTEPSRPIEPSRSTEPSRRTGPSRSSIEPRQVAAASPPPVPQRHVVDWTRDPAPTVSVAGSPVGLAARRRVPPSPGSAGEVAEVGRPTIGRPNDFAGPAATGGAESAASGSKDKVVSAEADPTALESAPRSQPPVRPARESDPRTRVPDGDSRRSADAESGQSGQEAKGSGDEPPEDSSSSHDSDLEDFLL